MLFLLNLSPTPSDAIEMLLRSTLLLLKIYTSTPLFTITLFVSTMKIYILHIIRIVVEISYAKERIIENVT